MQSPASPKFKKPPPVKECPAVQEPGGVHRGPCESLNEAQSDDVPDVETAKAQMIVRLNDDGRRHGYPILFNFIAEQLADNGLIGARGTQLAHVMGNVDREDRPTKKKPAAALKDLLINAGLEIVEHQEYGTMVRCPMYWKYMTEFSKASVVNTRS